MPIISSAALAAGAIIRFFGPECIGGKGDLEAKTDAEVVRTGLSADEIGPKVHILYHTSRRTNVILYSKMYYRTEGKVIRIPGLPVMHDYEFFPQKVLPN